jgi:xanthine dehydrogenase YagS FAD-binding subunit
MKNFTYQRATSLKAASQQMLQPGSLAIAGGTNLLDRMKVFLDEPSQIIDISRLDLKQIESTQAGGLRIGALVTNTALADDRRVRQNYPLLSRAILSGASQQIRNVATVGGNILQRTRCPYYYDTAFNCNKRNPGSGCPAATGQNRMNAILGSSDQCVAVHPSDMCVALAAIDATVEVESSKGKRLIPFVDFHRLPGNQPQQDNVLQPGELITAVILPAMAFGQTGVYLKLRDRTSYAFALVSVAAAIEVKNQKISQARIALGGVAHKPWRATNAEQFLIGRSLDEPTLQQAADLALQGAKPLTHNGFKVDMAKRAMRRAIAISANGGGLT